MKSKRKKPFSISFAGRSLSFTPLGARFVFICVALGAAAINSGSNLLYLVTAMMLSLMIVSGVLSEQALRGIRVTRRVPDEIYAATPFTSHYRIRNLKKRTSSFGLAVSGEYEGGPGTTAFVHRLGPGSEQTRPADEVAPSRGLWETAGLSVSTRFPFGLFEKSSLVRKKESVVVFPGLAPLDDDQLRRLAGGLGELPSHRKGAGSDIFNLRPYQPGDEARLIHWKSSARLSTLMVREFEQTQKDAVTVIFDNYAPAVATEGFDKLFEAGVSLAAAVVQNLMVERGLAVSLVTRDGVIGPDSGRAHYFAVMDRLAFIGPSRRPRDKWGPEADEAMLRALSGGPSVLVLIAGHSPWSAYSGRAGAVLEAGGEI